MACCRSAEFHQVGREPEASFEQFGYELRPGETLMILAGIHGIADGEGCLSAETAVANALEGKHDLSAAETHCRRPGSPRSPESRP